MSNAAPRRPILVTGSHRSGSTWVGRLLAAADGVHYVHEPFNIVARTRWTAHPPPHQFEYVTGATAAGWARELDDVIALRFPVAPQLVDALRGRRVRRVLGTARDARRARRHGDVALLKDPLALFSTEWLAERHGVQPVLVVRGPVSFVGSLKARQWAFDFRHWLDQPALMSDLLADYAEPIAAQVAAPGTIVEQGILQWNAFYSVVDRFRTRHPDWIVVRYEDLARAAADEVPRLYERLGLQFGGPQRAELERLTSGGDGGGSSAIDVRRDSAAALETWRDRLTAEELHAVREATAEVAGRFYGPADDQGGAGAESGGGS